MPLNRTDWAEQEKPGEYVPPQGDYILNQICINFKVILWQD